MKTKPQGLQDSRTVRKRLGKAIKALDAAQLLLLTRMAEAMASPITASVSPSSDIVTNSFSVAFSNQLLLHHATHEEKLNKKTFEYVFRDACETAGRQARINPDPTDAAEDVLVDGTRFSLKTEAAGGIRDGTINIQKLMEARWIRDFDSSKELAPEAVKRITRHLAEYERILVLRVFDHSEVSIRYELVEVPKHVLMLVSKLTPADFEEKNKAGGSGADVRDVQGPIFRLFLDGSVEKVRIFSLRKSRCVVHASWIIPRPKPTGGSSSE